MAQFKQSDRVRGIVLERYVRPALSAGKSRLSIRVRDVLKDAEATQDFPRGRTPLICTVLQSNKFLKETGLEIESIDGPPSKQSRTVVVHYRVMESDCGFGATPAAEGILETSAQRAKRLTDKLRGLLKEEIAAFGGADAFVRWVRSDDDDGETAAR